MKIFVSAYKNDMESEVCPTFGRAPLFLVVELEDGNVNKVTEVKNTNTNVARGAGISTAQLVVNGGCKVLITGNVGPNAFSMLDESGVKIFRAFGMKIKDAIKSHMENGLDEITSAGGNEGRGRFRRGYK
ncbi:MAG: NifB/NifX family molybdenum-iron cluster-binding protein [Candidatus Aenigmarchaeota archaeon]|nr:NifB/NifX family molybdenum-iron cluster-binding protein [Candidatus Aenigmarchaeota archaeon]